MNHYPASLKQLIDNLARLPGIGRKSAERLALHILKASHREADLLASSIVEVKKRVRLCRRCFALAEEDYCPVCTNMNRDHSRICVVEKPADMAAIEMSGGYNGSYHILQGALSPMDGIGPDDLRIAELLKRVDVDGPSEVILATGTNVEGEATAAFISEKLHHQPVRVTRIASGVPMGGDLKYVDQVTLKRAMETRHDTRYLDK
ncbi:recombination mediator RecR [Desulfoluna sp.]|uniref:recombination mediator RecR n=1 Tax=Desulfoluna sp. TaxID=2045199 RepID=UPI00261C66F8|nr:recombination mediator RecR [Desulfoluna sp.]